MAERGGLLGDDGRLDGDLLGVGAFDALIGHAEHGVAGFEIGDAGADLADEAGEVAAENVRKPVELIAAAAAPNLGVGAVDAGRVDIDHHLARPRLRVRRLAERSISGPPWPVKSIAFMRFRRWHSRHTLAKSPRTPYLMP